MVLLLSRYSRSDRVKGDSVRKQYSKKDIREFISHTPLADSIMTAKSDVVQKDDVLYVDNTLSFIRVGDMWIPSLVLLQSRSSLLPHVVVDKGAIRFVVNGADVMRPGINDAEAFEKGAYVVVVDETVGKPIAVCRALYESQELLAISQGRVLENLHHVGDRFWNGK